MSSWNNGIYATAVDGKTDPLWFAGGSCVETASGDYSSWLAVDLGTLTYVYGINFTNRGDCCGMSSIQLRFTLRANYNLPQMIVGLIVGAGLLQTEADTGVLF
jgi:hypothetical protein